VQILRCYVLRIPPKKLQSGSPPSELEAPRIKSPLHFHPRLLSTATLIHTQLRLLGENIPPAHIDPTHIFTTTMDYFRRIRFHCPGDNGLRQGGLRYVARALYEEHILDSEPDVPRNGWAFRVLIPGSGGHSVSVSSCLWKSGEKKGDFDCIETALFDSSGSFVEIPELGYGDVCLSEGTDALINDIKQLFAAAKVFFSQDAKSEVAEF
jgi:hypothetical protein